jgi:hypothetical protein
MIYIRVLAAQLASNNRALVCKVAKFPTGTTLTFETLETRYKITRKSFTRALLSIWHWEGDVFTDARVRYRIYISIPCLDPVYCTVLGRNARLRKRFIQWNRAIYVIDRTDIVQQRRKVYLFFFYGSHCCWEVMLLIFIHGCPAKRVCRPIRVLGFIATFCKIPRITCSICTLYATLWGFCCVQIWFVCRVVKTLWLLYYVLNAIHQRQKR